MAVSRPIVLALVGAVLVAALYLVTMPGRGSSDDSAESTPPPAAEAAKPSKPAAKPKSQAEAAATPAKASEEATSPAARARAEQERKLAAAGVPLDLLRALAKKRTVVLFFRQRGSADDEATAQAVASVRGSRGVTVFSEPISRLAKYRAIVDAAGVSQAPAVVVIGRKGARLVEGFVDRETLAQEVADSR